MSAQLPSENEVQSLREEVSRYENGRLILLQTIERLERERDEYKQKLTAAEQLAVRQANLLRRASR